MAQRKQKNIRKTNSSAPPDTREGNEGAGLSVSIRTATGLVVLFALFLLWYWGVWNRHLVYITHYFDVPRVSFLSFPGGGVRFLGDIPSLAAARCGIDLIGALLIVFYSMLPVLGMLSISHARRGSRLSPLWLFAPLPAVSLTILTSIQGYYHLSAIKTGEFYGTFLALGCALLLPRFCRLFSNRARLFVEMAVLALFYPLFGTYTFIAAAYIAREEYLSPERLPGNLKRAWRTVFPLVCAAAVPLAYFPLYAARVAPGALWTAGSINFPKELLDSGARQVSLRLFAVSLILALLPLIFTVFAAVIDAATKSPKQAPRETSGQNARRPGMGDILSAVVVVLLIAGIWRYSKSDVNYKALLASARPLEYDRWEELLEIEASCPEPTLPLVELRRLALARTGRIGQELFDRPNLPVTSIDLETSRTAALLGIDMATRSGAVNYGFWQSCELSRAFPESPYYRWLMFQCALIDNGPVTARKFLNLLRPMKRPDWVAAGEDILDAVESQTEPKTELGRRILARVELAKELRPQEYILHHNSVSHVLQESAMHRDFADCSLSAQEQILAWLLLVRDFDRFADDFDIYYKRLQLEKPEESIPRALQQGAIIVDFYKTNQYPVHQYPYDQRLVSSFGEFLRINAKINQNQSDPSGAERELLAAFPFSYWSYQHFIFNAPNY